MWCSILPLAILLTTPTLLAKEGADNWVEVRSPHFVVLTNSSEKQARHVAGQFERMRAVFHTGFPKARVDPPEPIIIIALRDKRAFQALEPEVYLAKGQLDLAGLFLRAPEKNYMLLRLDAQGDHPYASVYHEYTHLLLSDVETWLPLWLNEGLAEYFENTDIHEKDAYMGEPSREDIMLLRQNKLIPIETLLAVNVESPYYHQEAKGSIFYAESWALVHMLQVAAETLHSQSMAAYVEMVSRHVDPVTAGERAFGDLHQLQKTLELYISRFSFSYLKVVVAQDVNEPSFPAKTVPLPEADAIRAEFLAWNDRGKDARALLDTVLQQDPKNVSARETMGLLEFRAGNLESARKWYEQAVQLDSQSYLARYYYAAISMHSGAAVAPGQIEANLQAAIRLNPEFAPAYDALAMFYGMRREKLDQAHLMNLRAVALDPANLDFRLNTAMVLEEQDRYKDAVAVLKSSAGVAKTPEEAATLQARIKQAQDNQAKQTPAQAAGSQGAGQARPEYTGEHPTTKTINLPPPKHPTETPHGPRQTAQGLIQNVTCTDPTEMELKVEEGGKSVALYTNNYYDIPFSASNFTPLGDIHPCTDLNGAKASIQYFATADKTIDGQILSIALTK
jgi:tetratricopeptide (TPR) repeat protein